MKAKAFAPGNVSCIFRICRHKDPLRMGSLGVGFTTNKGITAAASLSKRTTVRFNKKRISMPTVKTALGQLSDKKIAIDFQSELPLGMGFGLSGACALSAALAVNKLLNLKKSRTELAKAAHYAEVVNHTGLGDVAGQLKGGFLIKRKQGNPLKAERLNVKEKIVYCQWFGKLDTKKVITNKAAEKRINKAGDMALKKIKRDMKLAEVIEISKTFAKESGLLRNKKVIGTIKEIENKGGKASMIMLGHAVFSNIPFKGAKRMQITKRSAGVL